MVSTRTPCASALHPTTLSPSRSSAPISRARRAYARTARSTWRNPPLGLPDGVEALGRDEAREACREVRSVDGFEGNAVALRRETRPGDHLAIGRTEAQQSAHLEERLAGVGFDLSPKVVGAAQEWDVVGVFEVGLANDAGVAVGAPAIVARLEAIDPEGANAPTRELIERARSAASCPDDDDIGALFHVRSLGLSGGSWRSAANGAPRASTSMWQQSSSAARRRRRARWTRDFIPLWLRPRRSAASFWLRPSRSVSSRASRSSGLNSARSGATQVARPRRIRSEGVSLRRIVLRALGSSFRSGLGRIDGARLTRRTAKGAPRWRCQRGRCKQFCDRALIAGDREKTLSACARGATDCRYHNDVFRVELRSKALAQAIGKTLPEGLRPDHRSRLASFETLHQAANGNIVMNADASTISSADSTAARRASRMTGIFEVEGRQDHGLVRPTTPSTLRRSSKPRRGSRLLAPRPPRPALAEPHAQRRAGRRRWETTAPSRLLLRPSRPAPGFSKHGTSFSRRAPRPREVPYILCARLRLRLPLPRRGEPARSPRGGPRLSLVH